MTGILGLALPPWLNPQLLGAVAITIAAAAGGAYIDHKFMMGKVNGAKLETAAVQSTYDAYKARTVADAAKATSDAAAEKQRLDSLVNDLQGKLAEQQRVANAKSQVLLQRLNAAKPGDIRPLGPNVLDYVERLRGP